MLPGLLKHTICWPTSAHASLNLTLFTCFCTLFSFLHSLINFFPYVLLFIPYIGGKAQEVQFKFSSSTVQYGEKGGRELWGTRCSDRDRGGLSASSKHRTTRHTLRLCMRLQTAVCFHIPLGTCVTLLPLPIPKPNS